MEVFEQQLQDLLQQSALQYIVYEKNGDTERLAKLNLFARKILQKEYVIGFAGHFSAGKSSMINALSGEDLLAASPIPTSANIVKVHKAQEDYAIVYMHNELPIKFAAGYDFKTVKELSKDGELVSQIEIGHSASKLPSGVTVMDTPGVDSTDDAHAMSTESALHIADIVFYTMDYNHVQSELNFQFTKELMKYNPNVYLIVNQIDKHRESELSFDQFKESVHQSFAAWGVVPKDIFFTTLKEKDHPHNDFLKVKKIVMDSMNDWQQQLVLTAKNTLAKLQDEHTAYLAQEKEDIIRTSEDAMTKEDWAMRADYIEQYEHLIRQTSLFSFEQWQQSFEEKRQQLLENAAIIPADFRDKLRDYLESKQDNFKVGGLFTAKRKTAEEMERRAQEVRNQYDTIVQSQIVGHMKQLMKEALKNVGALTDESATAIDRYDYRVSLTVIDEQIQEGALVTGDALLNFANRVAQATKRFFVRATDEWMVAQKTLLEKVATQSSAPVQMKIDAMQPKMDAIFQMLGVEQREQYSLQEMKQAQNETRTMAKNQTKKWHQDFEKSLATIRPFTEDMLKKHNVQENEVEEAEVAVHSPQVQIEKVMATAMKTADTIEHVEGFEEMARFIKNKVERLQKNDFTIALFGAFSAGKSSFSNALMGAKVLPVSPNPTTAAINKIRPVTAEHPHETADVTLKTSEQLLEDIQNSYAAIGMAVATLQEAYERAQEGLAVKLADERLNVHKSFIRAYSEGYAEFKSQLGEVIRVHRSDFELFVAQENKSCFVDHIDFYYDSPITRMGVTLVDTPGADSINARHTGVAFEYIRNADAILFITYYNHAFAKADREFLIQLGRVKDAFELDKMFFVVNAIDLANTAEEQEDVKNYVRNELQRFGIRFPRLYGVSSLQALQEKQEKVDLQSGMAPFEEAFQHFLHDELQALAVLALQEEVDKARTRLHDLIEQTESNLLRKDERLEELADLSKVVERHFANKSTSIIEADAKQELDELLYYVLQRVYYRYPDFFRESYNPSQFAKLSPTVALDTSLKEVLHALSFDFAQELRVTNFRLAQFVEKKLLQHFKEEARTLKEMNPSFAFITYEPEKPTIMEFEGPFTNSAKYASVKSYFKNVKSFFEKNEKEHLKEALEQLTKPDATNYLNQEKERLTQWAMNYVAEEMQNLGQYMQKQAYQQLATEQRLLNEESALPKWRQLYEEIK